MTVDTLLRNLQHDAICKTLSVLCCAIRLVAPCFACTLCVAWICCQIGVLLQKELWPCVTDSCVPLLPLLIRGATQARCAAAQAARPTPFLRYPLPLRIAVRIV